MSEGTTTINADLYAKYKWQIRKLKEDLDTATRDRESYKAEADQYRSDNAKLKEQWDASAVAKRLEVAEGKLKEVEYRKTWDRVAKSKGIREDALDAAYQLGGYKPAEGEIDENIIGEAIDAQKAKQTFLVAAKTETPAKPEAKTVPGSGQGVKPGSSGVGWQPPPDGDPRWSDNMWLWNTQDQRADYYNEKKAQGIV